MNAVMKILVPPQGRESRGGGETSLPAEQYPLLKKESIKVIDLLQLLS